MHVIRPNMTYVLAMLQGEDKFDPIKIISNFQLWNKYLNKK